MSARIDLNHKIHVLTKKEELDSVRIPGKVVVVLNNDPADDPQLYGPEVHLQDQEGFVRVAFRLAFWELLHAPSFAAGVIDAANRGGDADTNAAIAGALLGAHHGRVAIPDAWVGRAILGDPSPWDPLGLPWDGMPDTPGVPRDREARPSLDEVLALRRGRMDTVAQVIDGLTEVSLDSYTREFEEQGWPKRSHQVRKCLRVVLNEEWEHRLYAERDLAVLQAQGG